MVRVGKFKFIDIYAEDQHNKSSSETYVVYNTKKPFKYGHTHIRKYSTAEYIAKLIAYHKLPRNCDNKYLLESLIRLETDPDHIKILQSKLKKSRKH